MVLPLFREDGPFCHPPTIRRIPDAFATTNTPLLQAPASPAFQRVQAAAHPSKNVLMGGPPRPGTGVALPFLVQFGSRFPETGSKFAEFGSKFAELGSKSGEFASKFAELGSKSGAFASKYAELGSKSGVFASKFAEPGSKSGAFASKFAEPGSKSGAFASNHGGLGAGTGVSADCIYGIGGVGGGGGLRFGYRRFSEGMRGTRTGFGQGPLRGSLRRPEVNIKPGRGEQLGS